MELQKNKSVKIFTLIGSFSLLSIVFAGFSVSLFNPESATADLPMLPPNINVSDLTDAQVNSYYSGVGGLSGNNLLSALNGIIDGHREYDYDNESHRTAYKIMDRNWDIDPLSPAQLSNFNYTTDNGYIRKFYADYNDSVDTADRFKNDGATRVSFDKEHLWAQSLGNFGRTGGAGSDFHSLVPADVKGNQQMHSNYNYAAPTSGITNYNNDYETYVGRNGYITGSSQKVCEPLDEYKGDIARAMFYMPARYYTYVDTLHPKLTLVNGSPAAVTASISQPGLAGDLATLLQWNELDPVDDYEIHRNNLIYNNYQLNRNPFIDHPEWARIAYDTSYSGPGASIAAGSSSVGTNDVLVSSIELNQVAYSLEISEQFQLSATVLPANATNPTIAWSSSNNSVAGVSNGLVTANSIGEATITAAATDGSGISATCDITVSTSAKNLVSISVSGAAGTAAFGSDYSISSIVVTAHYDDSSSENVTSLSTINVPNTQQLGEQAILISFDGKTAYYDVFVTNNGASGNLNIEGVADDLIISEYIEGSSYNKVLEIYNGTGQNVSLSNYSIKLFSNGSQEAGTTKTFTDETIYDDSVLSLVYPSDTNAFKIGNYIESGVVNFNGNDAIGLFKNDVLIDLVGVIGTDPGTEWTGIAANGSGSTLNKTLVRISAVTSPSATFSFSQWNCYDVDTSSYLGSHSMDLPLSITDLDQAHAWADYFLNETSGQCEALEPQSASVWTLLENEYNFMTSTAKGHFTNGDSATILAAMARYNAIINAHPENLPFIDEISPSQNIDSSQTFSKVVLLLITTSTVLLLFMTTNRRCRTNTANT